MKWTIALFPIAAICLGMPTCGLFSKKSEKPKPDADKPTVEGPKLIGVIASVPADKRFVLIRGYGKWEATTGEILTTRGPEGRGANLRTTGENMGEFAAADIQSGTLELGDAVYSPPVPKAPVSESAIQPAQNETTAPIKNVQKNN